MNRIISTLVIVSLIACVVPLFTASAQLNGKAGTGTEIFLNEKWTGDFDGMIERGMVRILVVYNDIMFFLDHGRQMGTVPLMAEEFEKFINTKLNRKTLKINVILIPVDRDELITGLIEGIGDIASANLTITPERQKRVDFSIPGVTGIKETLITGPTAPTMKSVDDLSGKTLTMRKSSSYFESILKLNEHFKSKGNAPVTIEPAAEYMEDSDILEMVNAGLLEMAIVDSHKAEFWITVFDKLKYHPDIFIRDGGETAASFRKNSPKLKEILNEFVKRHRLGTMMGNISLKRYLRDNKWVRDALNQKGLDKFNSLTPLFQKYATKYDLDYLMTMAMAYQESQLDQNKRSHAGAIGIMQVTQSTANDPNIAISNIDKIEPNIHAGTKYLRFLRNKYFDNSEIDPLNQMLLSFAAYNAGPNRIIKLQHEAQKRDLNPNVWFNNVEVIVAQRIGRETVQYVNNIYKYYMAYRSIVEKQKKKKTLKE